jgi:mRNA interferase MazF
MSKPLRGQVWLVNLDPTLGHEQAKTRPCLIVSNNRFNCCAADLVIVVPLTSKNKAIPLHIKVASARSGLPIESFIMPEQIRSLAVQRCVKLIGMVDEPVLAALEEKLKVLLDFD